MKRRRGEPAAVFRPPVGIGPYVVPKSVSAAWVRIRCGPTRIRHSPTHIRRMGTSADKPPHPFGVGASYPIFPDSLFHVSAPEIGTATAAAVAMPPDFPHVAAPPAPDVQRVRRSPPSPARRRPDAQAGNLFLRCAMAPEGEHPCEVLCEVPPSLAPFAPYPSVAGRLHLPADFAPAQLPAAQPVAPPCRQATHAVLDPHHRLAPSREQVSPFFGYVAAMATLWG